MRALRTFGDLAEIPLGIRVVEVLPGTPHVGYLTVRIDEIWYQRRDSDLFGCILMRLTTEDMDRYLALFHLELLFRLADPVVCHIVRHPSEPVVAVLSEESDSVILMFHAEPDITTARWIPPRPFDFGSPVRIVVDWTPGGRRLDWPDLVEAAP